MKTCLNCRHRGQRMVAGWPAKIRAAQRQTTITVEGHEYARVPYGAEQEPSAVLPDPCRDCGVLVGAFHVSPCCLEACPRCLAGQRISCDASGCLPQEADA